MFDITETIVKQVLTIQCPKEKGQKETMVTKIYHRKQTFNTKNHTKNRGEKKWSGLIVNASSASGISLVESPVISNKREIKGWDRLFSFSL